MTKAKLKLLTGMVGVITSVALVSGGTMAWFTDKKDVQDSKFTAGTVEIQAGQSVVTDTGCSGKRYYEEVGPAEIVSVTRGTNSSGYKLPNQKAKQVFGAVSGVDADSYSMGYGGSIVVRLNKALAKGDVLVIENTLGTLCNDVETAKVYVSQTGAVNTWNYAGTASNQTCGLYFHMSALPSPIENAQYVKLVDTTPKTVGPWNIPNISCNGFDIDYICGRNILDEVNWNPGDVNKIAFYVNNSGTKDIQVRAKLTAKWVDKNGNPVNLSTDVVNIALPKGSDWYLEKDGTYHYRGYLQGIKGGETAEAANHPSNSELNLTVTLKGAETGNQYQGLTYQIIPTFEAIQNSHSDSWSWASFDTYNSNPAQE